MIVDLDTYRRTRKIVERIPIQHTSFTIGDVRHQFASHFPDRWETAVSVMHGTYADTIPSDVEQR